MTPDQLRHLADAFKASPRDADAFLEVIIESRLGSGVAVKGNGSRLYLVERPGPEVGQDTPTGGRLHHLGQLMRLAGLGSELRKLVKGGESRPGANWREQIPAEEWVVEAMRTPSRAQPDVQALACMRLQDNLVFLAGMPWIRTLAAERLSQLLVEFPALMHPRLAFEWRRRVEGRDSDPSEPHSMALFFANCPDPLVAMPIVAHGVTIEGLRAFAEHPVVAAGIRAKASVIVGINIAHAETQGFTMLRALSRPNVTRPGLVASMLLLDRLRHEAGSKRSKSASLFVGRNGDDTGFLGLIGATASRFWVRGDTPAALLYKDLWTSELRRSPTFSPGARTLNAILWHSDLLFRGKSSSSTRAPAPAVDQVPMFERLTQLFVDVGSAPDQAAASVEVMKAVFPESGEALSFSASVELATRDAAHRMIGSWLSAGVDLTDIRARVGRFQSSDDSPWVQALQPYVHEKAMRDTIDAAGAGHAADAGADPVSTSRPRRSRVL